jgi:hypothetical protein
VTDDQPRAPGSIAVTAPVLSPQRRRELIDALRRGTVPRTGLDVFAVGLDRFAPVIDDELRSLAAGGATFKALRGDYGAGKTFTARWIAERARRAGLATTEVQVSERETPLHRLETVYRRLVERLAISTQASGALRTVVDGWFYALEEEALSSGTVVEDDDDALLAATSRLMEARLVEVSRTAPAFAAALRGYRRAVADGDSETADGLLAWLGGQPNVAAGVKRAAGIKGDLDHFGALSALEGLLTILRDSGYPGLLLILDEVETVQRVRGDVRERWLNALRQLIDEIDAGRFPGLYLLITGTPALFDGPQGVPRLPPLAARLATDFATDARWDNPRAVQLRLTGFTIERLGELGRRIRDIYAAGASPRIPIAVDDAYVLELARAVTGELGGQVGIVPRLYLKKLVGDVLDRVDQFPDFDPRRDYALTVNEGELSDIERNARAAGTVDEIDLDLDPRT